MVALEIVAMEEWNIWKSHVITVTARGGLVMGPCDLRVVQWSTVMRDRSTDATIRVCEDIIIIILQCRVIMSNLSTGTDQCYVTVKC